MTATENRREVLSCTRHVEGFLPTLREMVRCRRHVADVTRCGHMLASCCRRYEKWLNVDVMLPTLEKFSNVGVMLPTLRDMVKCTRHVADVTRYGQM